MAGAWENRLFCCFTIARKGEAELALQKALEALILDDPESGGSGGLDNVVLGKVLSKRCSGNPQ